jgi:hypothetical protein
MRRAHHPPVRPTPAQLARTHDAMRRAMTQPAATMLDSGTAPGGWRWDISSGWIDGTGVHASAERPGVALAEAFATVEEARAWVGRLTGDYVGPRS